MGLCYLNIFKGEIVSGIMIVKNNEKSVWIVAFRFSAYAIIVVSILSVIFYFTYLRYYSPSFVPESPGDGQEGLIVILAPVIPHLYVLDIVNASSTPSDQQFFIFLGLAPITIYLPYYLIGLIVAFIRRIILSRRR